MRRDLRDIAVLLNNSITFIWKSMKKSHSFILAGIPYAQLMFLYPNRKKLNTPFLNQKWVFQPLAPHFSLKRPKKGWKKISHFSFPVTLFIFLSHFSFPVTLLGEKCDRKMKSVTGNEKCEIFSHFFKKRWNFFSVTLGHFLTFSAFFGLYGLQGWNIRFATEFRLKWKKAIS